MYKKIAENLLYFCALKNQAIRLQSDTMSNEELFDLALRIAIQAHKGQRDKSGRVYVMHPIRVAERCRDPKAKVVALLHDTIEDTEVTADYLRMQGFPEEIIEGVLSVTKREGETYEDFVRRAAQNPLGKEVKRADLEDNMDIRRLREITDEDATRLRKYLRAWQFLNDLQEKGQNEDIAL